MFMWLNQLGGRGTDVLAGISSGQRGDKITATSATMSSSQMWEKNSMEGVMSAVNSAALVRGQVCDPPTHTPTGCTRVR